MGCIKKLIENILSGIQRCEPDVRALENEPPIRTELKPRYIIRYDENSDEMFVRHLTNAEQIIVNALSMVESVENNFGSTEGYEFYINQEHEKILKKSAIYLNNFGIPKESRLFGHKVNVSDNCPLDKIYFMIPIDVD